MTSTDQSDQKRYQPRVGAMSPPASLLGDGGRVLLLAVGGFFVVRIALALLHLT
jgi:hypothetical protein